MPLFKPENRAFAECLGQIDYCNPFLPSRIDLERKALGSDFVDIDSAWNMRADSEGHHANLVRLTEHAEQLVRQTRDLLAAGQSADETEMSLYEDVVIFFLYHHYYDPFLQYIAACHAEPGENPKPTFYRRFLEDVTYFTQIPGARLPGGETPEMIFAFLFQVRRAFYHIFSQIVGSSRAISRLRAAVWQSIFTHNARRYRRTLYARMGDITTLITGASGTGKELAARAVGLARFVPFNAQKGAFEESFAASFHPLNLSALSPTLIESELFGHCRGTFTGAVSDRAGWLESCGRYGTVFLDEIGDLDAQIQVKLLRVLQSRMFQRIGESRPRMFAGKIIAATNRDLAAEILAGRFREDLYYRICSDLITTPSLSEQLADSPGELVHLIRFIARQIAPEETESLAKEVQEWIHEHVGDDYSWPGNFRELEQCVRNVVVRGEYRPARHRSGGAREDLAKSFLGGQMTADELLKTYCTIVYHQTHSYVATAERLGIDRRTAKAKLDPELLAQLDK